MLYTSINPANEEKFAEYPLCSDEVLEEALSQSVSEFRRWRNLSIRCRADLLGKVAVLIQNDKDRLALLLTREMGKPLAQSEAELARAAAVADYYSKHAESLLTNEELPEITEKHAFIRYDPLGTVFAITPWNYPASLLARAVIPALISGNAVILKPAPNVPGISLELERIFQAAGFPPDIFKVLFLSNRQAAGVIQDRRIRLVSFTGSVAAGREIGRLAGGALKKVTLELGGNDAFIVRSDADPSTAARAAVAARCNNAGQICCAPKRFIVHTELLEKFSTELISAVQAVQVGDPLHQETQVGPLARADLRDNLRHQVETLRQNGAEICALSRFPQGRGYFYPVTFLRLASPCPFLETEELFGPVLPVQAFDNDSQAVNLANSTPFGLAASIFGRDMAAIEDMAAKLECGMVSVNCSVAVDPRLPFGGIKDSGFGRAYGREGLRENTNSKTVVFAGKAPASTI